MQKDVRDGIPANQPALIVTYGHTARKYRPLDGALLVLGRAASCDFSLVSPEVAPVHCVLARGTEGWRLRDCSGRPGTRVNGKFVQETPLVDGDLIQVGSFSFEVHLPPGSCNGAARPVSPSQVAHLQRSRRNLVRLALRLRKGVGDRAHSVEDVEDRLIAQRAEVSQQVEVLRARQREFELRMTRLELSERDLATDRATLDREYRAFQDDVARHAADVKLFNERVALQNKELEEHRAKLSGAIATRGQAIAAAAESSVGERKRQLDQRSRELEHYAQHLRRLYCGLTKGETGKGAGGHRDTKAELLAQAEAALCKQQTQFEHLVADLRQLLEETRAEQRQQSERLLQENEQLRQQLEELVWGRGEPTRPGQDRKRSSGMRERLTTSGT